MSDYLALAILILLAVSVLVAAWYANRRVYGTTSFTVAGRPEFIPGALLSIGSGNRRELVRAVAGELLLDNAGPEGDRLIGTTVTVQKLTHAQRTGAEVKIQMNRAQRRAKRGPSHEG